ncbi:FxLYD domain-containing protein [Streptomyces sp. N35]|uniref:FxLYD domain-containing protein n=1 Tax=Streptomyces sp. N35 TaxID=2795730 RepID=UPI0018F65AAE|nr:FxLYD domain-containing protein [Streptomyces sp. N35]
MSSARIPGGPRRGRVALIAFVALTGAVLAGCSTEGSGDAATTFSNRASPPATENFSGEPPSPMASAAESMKAEVKASASAAEASASARASAFEESVSDATERTRQEFKEQLDGAEGQGNAMSEVGLTGKPLAETNGVRALVVNIRNRTDAPASYAVQVDFSDADGKVVETRIVGAQDLAPGERAQPLAISRKPVEPQLTAKIVKAQRY